MKFDIPTEIAAIDRTVERLAADDSTPERIGVSLKRRYDATIDDVWAAVTDPERIARWFLPVTGDLRAGGTFQTEGNAGGDILACQPPRLLRVTWGGPASVVEVRLSEDGDGTDFILEHNVPIELAQSGAGALWVGPGWDGAIMGLGLYLADAPIGDPATMAASREVQEFAKESAQRWAFAVQTSGTATDEQLNEAVAISLAQFAPDVD